MAVVRFSKELRDNILENAARPFMVRHSKEQSSLPKTYGLTMYEKGLGKYLETVKSLPSCFFDKINSIRVNIVKVRSKGEVTDSIQLTGSPEFPLGAAMPHPKVWADINPVKLIRPGGSYGNYTYYADMEDPQDAEFVTLVKDWRNRLNAIQSERETFVKSVEQVITAYTTLSPALKTWPPLWDLLPESARERHREVVDRKKRDPAEDLTVDLDKMTSVVTINKLLR